MGIFSFSRYVRACSFANSIKLFSTRMIIAFFLIGSLFLSNSLLLGSGSFMSIKTASAQLGTLPQSLGSLSSMNPLNSDFLSLAIGLVPHIPGADLNTTHLQDSRRCDVH